MKLWQKFRRALSTLLRKERLDREMDAEMRFHLEEQIKDNLQAGMGAEEARRAAWRSFGGLDQVKETCRDERGTAWVERLWQDVRYATRLFLKDPGVTTVAVVVLAVGIGANTVVFTWIRGTLLDAIPGAEHPERLVVVAPLHRSSGLGENMSIPDIESVGTEHSTFAGVTASQMGAVPVRLGASSEWLWGQTTLANYFDVLGVQPVLGRGFLPGEDRPGGAEGVAVISHSLWKRRFGASPDVLGRVIQINQRPATIVGVAPASFQGSVGGLRFDLWVPLATESGLGDLKTGFEARGRRWLQTIARLSSGVSLQRAQVTLATMGQRLEREFPETNKETTFTAVRTWAAPWGGQALFLPVLRVLAVVGGLLLLLVMANTGNLLLARGLTRQREMALRLALGCSPGRLTRQILIESLLLAGCAGIGGLLFAYWGRNILLALMPPSYLPIGYDLRLSNGIFGATAALTLLVGLAIGLAPAWRAVRVSLNENLKTSGTGATVSRPQVRLRSALAVGQVALALVLLLAMGLCARSYSASRKMNLGFEPSGVWLAGFRLNPHSDTDDFASTFFRRLQTEAQRLPGIESAALSSYIPLGIEGIDLSSVKVPGYTAAPGESMNAGIEVVSPGYLKTMRIQLAGGREFTDLDEKNTPLVAIVNEVFARKYFPGRDPVGLKFDSGRGEARIVGLAKTGKYRSLGEPPLPYFYLCAWQHPERNMTLALRATGNSSQVNQSVTALALSLDPEAPPHASMSCADYVRSAFLVPRVAASMLSFLGILALLLSAMGMYAVIAHHVRQRVREFAVRMALGARPGDVLWLVMRQGLRLVAFGIGLGAVAGLAVSLLIASLLVGISAVDLTTWLLVPLTLLAVVLAACWVPARLSLRSDLLRALRCE